METWTLLWVRNEFGYNQSQRVILLSDVICAVQTCAVCCCACRGSRIRSRAGPSHGDVSAVSLPRARTLARSLTPVLTASLLCPASISVRRLHLFVQGHSEARRHHRDIAVFHRGICRRVKPDGLVFAWRAVSTHSFSHVHTHSNP